MLSHVAPLVRAKWSAQESAWRPTIRWGSSGELGGVLVSALKVSTAGPWLDRLVVTGVGGCSLSVSPLDDPPVLGQAKMGGSLTHSSGALKCWV